MPVPRAITECTEPARGLWSSVTIRVAWELVLNGAPTRADTLAEVREHVLRGLPLGLSVPEAEELASQGVSEWLDRVRQGRYRRVATDPDLAIAVDAGWRQRLSAALDRVGDVVLKLHFGDGFPIGVVARNAAIDSNRAEAAREGIREAMRELAAEESLSLVGWPVGRVDRLIRRVATVAEPGCPGPGGLFTDEGRSHADRCPRCSRAVRLVRGGVLSPADLFPPEGDAARPSDRIRVLALLLHPDARRHHEAIAQAIAPFSIAVGADAWLVPETELEALTEALHRLALQGSPARHHLRGAIVGGSGRWARDRVLGPLPVSAVEAARSRPWGEIMGVDDLPAPLPPPPRAGSWWAAAALLCLFAIGMGAFVARPHPSPVDYPLQAAFEPADEGWQARFSTDELATVDVIVRRQGSLEVRHTGVREAKGRWATGQGDYRLSLDGEEALIVSSQGGVPDLRSRVDAARQDPDPLGSLEARIRVGTPGAALVRTPPRAVAKAL